MARSGFPWLCVDMEHAAIDWALAATLFGFIAEAGCVPLCRVPNGTHENIKRALDAGAWGIVAPMVDTVRMPHLSRSTSLVAPQASASPPPPSPGRASTCDRCSMQVPATGNALESVSPQLLSVNPLSSLTSLPPALQLVEGRTTFHSAPATMTTSSVRMTRSLSCFRRRWAGMAGLV